MPNPDACSPAMRTMLCPACSTQLFSPKLPASVSVRNRIATSRSRLPEGFLIAPLTIQIGPTSWVSTRRHLATTQIISENAHRRHSADRPLTSLLIRKYSHQHCGNTTPLLRTSTSCRGHELGARPWARTNGPLRRSVRIAVAPSRIIPLS